MVIQKYGDKITTMPANNRPLRICLLSYRSNPHCGGQGVYLKNLSRAIKDLGHKVALADSAQGDAIVKYDEQIGNASKAIKKGDHVHTHNLKTARW